MTDGKDVRRAVVRATVGALTYSAACLLGWTPFSWWAAAGAALLFPVVLWGARMVVLDVQHAWKDEVR